MSAEINLTKKLLSLLTVTSVILGARPATAASVEMIHTLVLGVGASRLVAKNSVGQEDWGGLTVGFGALGYLTSAYENLYFRTGILLEQRDMAASTINGKNSYSQMVIGIPVGLTYKTMDVFWPFLGSGLEFTVDDECRNDSVPCPNQSFKSFNMPLQAGVALGALENFKLELVYSNQLLEVSPDIKSSSTLMIFLHIYPE